MAKKKMFDVKQVGQFLFKKGERVGLAISAVILLMFVFLGLMAGASTENWVPKLKQIVTSGTTAIVSPEPPPDLLASVKEPPIDWPLRLVKDIPSQVGWGAIEEHADTKRRNPSAKPILEQIQLDYVQGARYTYDVDLVKREAFTFAAPPAAGKQANVTPLRTIQPNRMVVCSAPFPYREQLEDFQQHLRFADLSQLLASKDDIPKFLGLIVKRIEVVNGKDGEEIELFKYDEVKDTVIAASHLDTALRESFYQTVPAELRTFVRPGLVTPLPELAIGVYPQLDLPPIKAEAIYPLGSQPNEKGVRPAFPFGQPVGNPPPAAAGGPPNKVQFDALAKPLQEKFNGKLSFFDPYEGNDPQKNVGLAPVAPMRIEGAGEKGGQLPDGVPDRILVRFFDTEVKPGSTYRYSIQIRLHNPNFGKTKEVATAYYAEIKEFRSAVKETPTITVPRELGLYAIDQSPIESKALGTERAPLKENFAPVQIHRWVEKSESGNRVGDWAVAERLLVRKGETIGGNAVIAEVPEWIADKERFEIGKTSVRVGVGKQEDKPGIKIDFRISNPSPILVDFTGGNRKDYRDDLLKGVQASDDAELDLLILNAQGKLVVRSSSVDAKDDNPIGRERLLHYNQWRERLRSFGGGGTGADPKQKGGGLFPGS